MRWILALVFVACVIGAAAIFVHRDAPNWWRNRMAARAQARKDRADRAAARARLNEELAAKYIPRRGR